MADVSLFLISCSRQVPPVPTSDRWKVPNRAAARARARSRKSLPKPAPRHQAKTRRQPGYTTSPAEAWRWTIRHWLSSVCGDVEQFLSPAVVSAKWYPSCCRACNNIGPFHLVDDIALAVLFSSTTRLLDVVCAVSFLFLLFLFF